MSEKTQSAKALKAAEAEAACQRQVDEAVAYNAIRHARRAAKYA